MTHRLHADHPEVVRELEKALAHYQNQMPPGPPLGWVNLEQ